MSAAVCPGNEWRQGDDVLGSSRSTFGDDYVFEKGHRQINSSDDNGRSVLAQAGKALGKASGRKARSMGPCSVIMVIVVTWWSMSGWESNATPSGSPSTRSLAPSWRRAAARFDRLASSGDGHMSMSIVAWPVLRHGLLAIVVYGSCESVSSLTGRSRTGTVVWESTCRITSP